MARAMLDESIDIIKMMKITGLSEEKLVYRKKYDTLSNPGMGQRPNKLS